MKNFLFIIISLVITCCTLNVKAIQQDTAYKQNSDLKKFDGIWEYVDSNITFKVVLKAQKIYLRQFNTYIDLVQGYHYLTRNNKLVQNASKLGKETITSGGVFYDFITKTEPKNTIRFTFTDLERKIQEEGRVELLPGNRLKWTVKNMEHLGSPGEKTPDFKIYVPNNVILNKVN